MLSYFEVSCVHEDTKALRTKVMETEMELKVYKVGRSNGV